MLPEGESDRYRDPAKVGRWRDWLFGISSADLQDMEYLLARTAAIALHVPLPRGTGARDFRDLMKATK